MSTELDGILSRLPSDQKLTAEVCEFLDKEIRRGVFLNALQRQGLIDIVRICLEQGIALPAPFESFWAYVYQEWADEAKTSEEVKKRLAGLVQKLKANGTATTVVQTLQKVLKEREARKQEMAKLAAAMAESAGAVLRGAKQGSAVREPPNIYLTRLQSARMGTGDNPTPNLELAVQLADEAVEAYPNFPKILFEAAGCHQLLAETGTLHSVMVRYVHMKEAFTLYQQCLTILSNPPYGKLKEGYDKWRKGLVELIGKVQKELATLQEQQDRLPFR
jgi:hypothetical protein